MRIGNLRDRVTFQRKGADNQTTPSGETDIYGNPIDDYGNSGGEFEDYLTVWADMREVPGKERVAAGLVEASRMATIRVRYSTDTAGLTEADRVKARGTVWNIRSISQPNRVRDVLELLCETGVAT